MLPFFSLCVQNSALTPVKAERKKYEKETEKYYSSLEKLLNMSAKKKEPQLQEVLTPAPPLSCSLSPYAEMKHAEMENWPFVQFVVPVFTFASLAAGPCDFPLKNFSWPARRGNVDSLVLFGPEVRVGCCVARGRNSALRREHASESSK